MSILLALTWILLGVFMFKRGLEEDSPIVAIGFLLIIAGIAAGLVPFK